MSCPHPISCVHSPIPLTPHPSPLTPQAPISLRDIQAKLTRYQSRAAFERDVRLIFSNCAWFNEPWSEAAQDGKRTLAPRTSPVSNALPALTPLP